jgi:DNA repair exonuclease SbcCD ATPase subunit
MTDCEKALKYKEDADRSLALMALTIEEYRTKLAQVTQERDEWLATAKAAQDETHRMRLENDKLRTQLAEMTKTHESASIVPWVYCPECGNGSFHVDESISKTHRQCIGCGQEWFCDINYSDVMQENLISAHVQLAEITGKLEEADRCIENCGWHPPEIMRLNAQLLLAASSELKLREAMKKIKEHAGREPIQYIAYNHANNALSADPTPLAKAIGKLVVAAREEFGIGGSGPIHDALTAYDSALRGGA